ncbi:hypothetical protein J4410_00205 [Candidatus Woesearchaeota archaeon]|nr:hypothetical protein [Candidatus Woesearchaeota archaeon]
MDFTDYFKIFIAGFTFPSLLFPFVAWFLAANEGIALLQYLPLYMLGIFWGIWNVLYFLLVKPHIDHVPNTKMVFGLHGVMLGLILYLLGTLVFDIPTLLGIPSWFAYVMIIIVPFLYYLLWCYLVAWINTLFDYQV